MQTAMSTRALLTGIAALFLATGTTHAQTTQFGPWQMITQPRSDLLMPMPKTDQFKD
jgi:hypothetical protein